MKVKTVWIPLDPEDLQDESLKAYLMLWQDHISSVCLHYMAGLYQVYNWWAERDEDRGAKTGCLDYY